MLLVCFLWAFSLENIVKSKYCALPSFVEIELHNKIKKLFKKVEYYWDKLMLPFWIVESCSLIMLIFGTIVSCQLFYLYKWLVLYLSYLILPCFKFYVAHMNIVLAYRYRLVLRYSFKHSFCTYREVFFFPFVFSLSFIRYWYLFPFLCNSKFIKGL